MRHSSIMESIRYFGRRRNVEVPPSSTGTRIGRSAPSNDVRGMFAILVVTTLTGCAVHPIVDNVSPIPTQAIVAAARCELRLGLVHQVEVWFADESPPVTGFDPNTIAEHLQEMKKRFPNVDLTNDWNVYMDIAVAYDWTFDITETDHADSGLGFKVPFVHPGSFDLTTSGSLTAIRNGKRTFKNQDTFSSLLTKDWYDFCNDRNRSVEFFPNTLAPGHPFEPRPKNLIYPITGSIGLGEAVTTFLKIAAQGAQGPSQDKALDTFTDELTFTTTIDGKLGAGITLSPVPRQFRLVNASANLTGNRVDLHKVKVSLTFPKARPTQKPTKKQLAAGLAKDLDVKGGYRLNANWRAAYALCVVDGRSREDELKTLRLDPPEETCLASTDAFYPRGDGKDNSLRTGSRQDYLEEKRRLDERAKSGGRTETDDRIRQDGPRQPDDPGRSGARPTTRQ